MPEKGPVLRPPSSVKAIQGPLSPSTAPEFLCHYVYKDLHMRTNAHTRTHTHTHRLMKH